jgi:hypothetical protein
MKISVWGVIHSLARPLISIFFLANKSMALGHELFITLSYPISNKKKVNQPGKLFSTFFVKRKRVKKKKRGKT